MVTNEELHKALAGLSSCTGSGKEVTDAEMFEYARECNAALKADDTEALERLSEEGRHRAGGFTVDGTLIDPETGEIQD
jgi:hypothetical protein